MTTTLNLGLNPKAAPFVPSKSSQVYLSARKNFPQNLGSIQFASFLEKKLTLEEAPKHFSSCITKEYSGHKKKVRIKSFSMFHYFQKKGSFSWVEFNRTKISFRISRSNCANFSL